MLIDLFHNLYNDTFKIKSKFFVAAKIPAILRLCILNLANFIIPLGCRFFKTKSLSTHYLDAEGSKGLVVSLTSFPQRINKVYLVIESLLRQSLLPSRIILWLSEEQFPSIERLPKSLLKLRSKGLEIRLTPGDLRSYKKYYFLLKESPSSSFIIVDDDVFYPSSIIKTLVETEEKYPNAICANRCAKIYKDKPYREWPNIRGKATGPEFKLLPTGCGGVLYPKNSLYSDSLNKNLFTTVCKDADDIWLSCMAFINRTPTVYTGNNQYLLSVNSLGNVHLHTGNVLGANNDACIKRVKEHYQTELGIDVFDR